ncbi:unnamed protein product, partial [Meganyctiphanes norvegica]
MGNCFHLTGPPTNTLHHHVVNNMSNMSLASGHKVIPLEGEELAHRERDFTGESMGTVRLEPGRWLFPKAYTRFADNVYNFKWRQGDVCIMTWPKCGTTWMQEIIWNMRNNPNLDNPEVNKPLFMKSPFLEFDMIMEGCMNDGSPPPEEHPFQAMCPGADRKDGIMIQMSERLADPRTIKTHLPFSLLSPNILDNAKVVYVARNPKDAVVSYHHHCRLINMHGYKGSFEDFVKYFIEDNLMYGPYWLTLKEAWEKRNHPNVYIMYFEDMKKDIIGQLKKLDAFIGTNLTEKQFENIAEWTSFAAMKAREEQSKGHLNKEVMEKDGGFLRKGVTGDWKNKLTPELESLVDDWTKKNISGLGVEFK